MTFDLRDCRLTPARPDLAAEILRGRVSADRFVPGEARTVTAALVPLRRAPRPDAPLQTQALRGEAVTVYEESQEGWAWVQLRRDGYVGYVPTDALGAFDTASARVAVLRTLVYPGPDLKLPASAALTLGATCRPGETVKGFAALPEGFVWAAHLAPVDRHEADFVAVAERFLEVPYLWGGKSSLGIDCSGLVQLSLAMAGHDAPRDSDLQEARVGVALPAGSDLSRGDLVFWKGHVGIMRDPTTLLHANAHVMMVASEPLKTAIRRIRESSGAEPTSIRRLAA